MSPLSLRLVATLLAWQATVGGAVGGSSHADLQVHSLVDGGPRCQKALSQSQTKVSGNFAVLEASTSIGSPNSSDLLRRQVRALYDCHWLGRVAGDDLTVTVASDEKASKLSLASFAERYRIMIIRVNPWPGNLAKLPGYTEVLKALIAVSREKGMHSQQPTRVLLTDCCDVLFRKDAACFGGGSGDSASNVFDRFTETFARRGKKVVFSAERGTSMLMSQDDYLEGYRRAKSGDALADPPVGWLVPINRPLRDNSSKAAVRKRHFSHKAAELPPSPLLQGSGTPDVCTEVDGLCLHPKSFNTGLIMGELEPLTKVYEDTIRMCGPHCEFNRGHSSWQSSDQNPVGHYLIATKFCGGRCSLDYNFTMFHTMQGRPGVYRLSGSDEQGLGGDDTEAKRLLIHIPVVKRDTRDVTSQDVIATKEWIALSPEVFGEDWFPVPACALHAAGLPEPHQVANLALLRAGLGVPGPATASWSKDTNASKVQLKQVVVGSDGMTAPLLASDANPPRSRVMALMRHG